jgi:hypothetical protein
VTIGVQALVANDHCYTQARVTIGEGV